MSLTGDATITPSPRERPQALPAALDLGSCILPPGFCVRVKLSAIPGVLAPPSAGDRALWHITATVTHTALSSPYTLSGAVSGPPLCPLLCQLPSLLAVLCKLAEWLNRCSPGADKFSLTNFAVVLVYLLGS